MEGSENILETIFEEENLEDVEMHDADSFEEGEIEDDKLSIESTTIDDNNNNGLIQAALTENPVSKFKKTNKWKKKKRPRPVSTITDISRFVFDTCKRLKEKKSYLIWNAVGCLGVAAVNDIVKEVYAIQACGGQMTADGKRARNGGGILWNILKSREPRAYKEIMAKGKELEKQFRKPNTQNGKSQVKDMGTSESITRAPSDPMVDQASDASQYTPQVQDDFEAPCDDKRRVSALNRVRVPVAYDDLVGKDVKDEVASDPMVDQVSDASQYTPQVQDDFETPCDDKRRVSALNRLRVLVAYDDLVGEDVKDEVASDPMVDQASDASQYTPQVHDDFEAPCDDKRRVSALNRLRVPVAYDDLVGQDVKDEVA